MDTERRLLLSLRRWIAISMIVSPAICLLSGFIGFRWSNDFGFWFQSISAMYWSSARNIMVGLISIVSIFLILYRGYDWRDRVINIASGLCFLGIIAFPSYSKAVLANNFPTFFEAFPNIDQAICNTIHRRVSMVAFLIQTINLAFVFTLHKGEMTEKKKVRNIIYKVLAGCTVAVFIVTFILSETAARGRVVKFQAEAFVLECLAFIFIGIAWLVKSESLKFLNDE